MINSSIFNYVDILDKAADAAYIRHDVISNNIANTDTPNYKRQDVQFETILQASLAGDGSLSERVEQVNMNLEDLSSYIYTDQTSLSYRLDGNNVDPEQEDAYLAENTIRYQTLIDLMKAEFQQYQTVLSTS